MNSVKINRVELLQIVRENLAKHQADYLEATEDYKVAAAKIAESNIKIAKSNQKILLQTFDVKNMKPFEHYTPIQRSYESDYKRAERMLQLSIEENIDVEEDVFNQLVLDEWSWKQQFVASSTMYKTMNGSL